MSEKPTYDELMQRVQEFEKLESGSVEKTQFNAVFNQQFQFMAILTPKGRVLKINDLALTVQGRKRNEFVGKLFWETPSWKDLPDWQEIIRERIFKVQLMNEMLRTEDVYQFSNGTVRYADAVTTALRDSNGEVVYVLIQATDITERKQLQKELEENNIHLEALVKQRTKEKESILNELKESEEIFRNFNEQSFVGFYIFQDDVFKYVNPKFADIFGYTIDECLNGMHLDHLVHPEDLATVQKQIRMRLAGEVNVVHYTVRGITKTRKINHVSIYGSIFIYKGRPAAIGTLLDITDAKRTEDEREQLIFQLQDALKEIRTLSGMLPICSSCKKIRDDQGYWKQVESYISDHSDVEFSHSICPECAKKLYPDLDIFDD